jgi:hypothetical protein
VPDEIVVAQPTALANWTPSFAVGVNEAVAAVEAKRDFFRRVMREDEHYGKIPGTGDKAKPTLLKPGAELLLANMGLRPELIDADAPTIDYGDGEREGMIRYRRACIIYRQVGPGVYDRIAIARAEGSCTSRETKYRWRDAQRVCPECGKPAIILGKKEYGGGFICFKKKGGCGAKFRDDDAAITSQRIGREPNPDLADLENTILKMADKRALVAATLLATGCSDLFTQDQEDFVPASSGARADDIEGEYVAKPVGLPSDLAIEIRAAVKALGGDDEKLATAVKAASEGVTETLENLTVAQGEKLLRVLRGKIAVRHAQKATAPATDTPLRCPICMALPEANGEVVDHKRDAGGNPCPNDTSKSAEETREILARRRALQAEDERPIDDEELLPL